MNAEIAANTIYSRSVQTFVSRPSYLAVSFAQFRVYAPTTRIVIATCDLPGAQPLLKADSSVSAAVASSTSIVKSPRASWLPISE